MAFAREPSTLMLPWISDGFVLVTWLTIVRALMPMLLRSAPVFVTLKDEQLLFETPPMAGAMLTVCRPAVPVEMDVAVPPSATMRVAKAEQDTPSHVRTKLCLSGFRYIIRFDPGRFFICFTSKSAQNFYCKNVLAMQFIDTTKRAGVTPPSPESREFNFALNQFKRSTIGYDELVALDPSEKDI
ncbi:hypothetical protein VK92_16055 [Burkholderia sp. LK4]|nr:hypothetical protein VL00_02305 [Burkholderia cepacia]KMN59364.1 hypothetical protein VK92_16055 [Burkholderia sp. LK4]